MLGKILLTLVGAAIGTIIAYFTVGFVATFLFSAAACCCAGVEVSTTAGEIFRWIISAILGLYGSARIFMH